MVPFYSLLFFVWAILVCFFTILITLLLVLIFYPLSLILNKNKNSKLIRFLIFSIWGRLVFYSSLSRVKVGGIENIKNFNSNSSLLIVNHLSVFDIFVACFLPFDFVFFSKKEVFKIPFVGWSMKAANFISVDRKSRSDSSRALKQAIKLVNSGHNILMYPEGTRKPRELNELLPFKQGAFLIAKLKGTAIIPIVTYGTQNILDPEKKYQVRISKVNIYILSPITIEDEIHPANKNSSLSQEERIEKIREIMNSQYQKMIPK